MSCIPFVKQLLKIGRKLSKMASNLKIESYQYTKIEKVNVDITLDKIDKEYEKSSGYRSMSNESFSDQSIFIIDNLKKLGFEELQKENFEKMMGNYSSMDVSQNCVSKPPRSPWQDLNFNQNEYVGFDEKLYFNLNHELFLEENSTQVSTECSSFSYSPMSSYGSYNFLDSETSTNQALTIGNNIKLSETEFTNYEFNDHLNKTHIMKTFLPSAASTPFTRNTYCNNFLVEQEKFDCSIIYQEQKHVKKSTAIPETKRRSRNKPNKKSLENFCVFCKNNGEPIAVYKFHTVKDAKGRILCPRLRIYKCPICGKDGDEAHTTKYCPDKKIITYEDIIKIEALKSKYKR